MTDYVQVPAELVEALREAERLIAQRHGDSFPVILRAARALVDAIDQPAPTVPRIARSIDDLRVGMTIAWENSSKWRTCVLRTDDLNPEDWGREFVDGRVVILSEPPAPTMPTTPGSVIEATHPRLEGTLWFRSAARGWVNTNDRAGSESNLTLVRVLFDAGADA